MSRARGWARRAGVCAAATGFALLAGCGRKAPPLPPLRPLPNRIAEVVARSVEGRVELRFTLPGTNVDNTSPPALGRVDIYARSVPEGSARPVREQIVVRENLVGSITVKPPAPEQPEPKAPKGESAPPAKPAAPPRPVPPPDTRPAAGDPVRFTETVPTDAPKPLPALRRPPVPNAPMPGQPPGPVAAGGTAPPVVAPPGGVVPPVSTVPPVGAVPPPAAVPPAGTAPPGGAPAAAAPAAAAPVSPPKPAPPTRYYMLVPVAIHGQLGTPSDLIAVPLTPPPPPPSDLVLANDEKTLTASWKPGGSATAFHVYEVSDAGGHETTGRPLATPATPEFKEPVAFGTARCLSVRSIEAVGTVALESAPATACRTPTDVFPPPAPAGLEQPFVDNGTVTLRWTAVSAPDLGGYLVFRRDAPNGPPQQITAAPIAETTYRDTAVRVGATYVYTIVAVDKASPPNRSAESEPRAVVVREP